MFCMTIYDTELDENAMEEGVSMYDFEFPDEIVHQFFDLYPELREETAEELRIPLSDATYDRWADEVHTADDTIGLYAFAKAHGFVPEAPVAVWND